MPGAVARATRFFGRRRGGRARVKFRRQNDVTAGFFFQKPRRRTLRPRCHPEGARHGTVPPWHCGATEGSGRSRVHPPLATIRPAGSCHAACRREGNQILRSAPRRPCTGEVPSGAFLRMTSRAGCSRASPYTRATRFFGRRQRNVVPAGAMRRDGRSRTGWRSREARDPWWMGCCRRGDGIRVFSKQEGRRAGGCWPRYTPTRSQSVKGGPGRQSVQGRGPCTPAIRFSGRRLSGTGTDSRWRRPQNHSTSERKPSRRIRPGRGRGSTRQPPPRRARTP